MSNELNTDYLEGLEGLEATIKKDLFKGLEADAVEADQYIYREEFPDVPIRLTRPLIGMEEGGEFTVATLIPSPALQVAGEELAKEGQDFAGVVLKDLPVGSTISFKDDGEFTVLVVDINNECEVPNE